MANMARKEAQSISPGRHDRREQRKLDDAEETLAAIRDGRADAIVVSGPEGARVFTLQGADQRYRRLVETMNEGAAIVSRDGTVLYANPCLSRMMGVASDAVVGRAFADFVAPAYRPVVEALLRRGATEAAKADVQPRGAASITIHLSASASGDSAESLCVIATDLSERQHMEEIVAGERLAASIFDQVAEAIVVCDQHGLILRASQAAHRLCNDNPLLRPFASVFPLAAPDGESAPSPDELLARALKGHVVSGLELEFVRNGSRRSLLVSAAPLFSAQRRTVGCVIAMTDISERKQVEEEKAALLAREQAARADAEAANRTKDEFLATMSHELRTPLNAMLGWAVMLRARIGDADLDRGLAVIERNARTQERLIGDLLDVSRIISGKLQIRLDPVELPAVAAAAVDVVRPAAEAKDITMHLQAVADLPPVSGDPDRLQQIVWNLVSNAVKFTPRGGSVWVDVSREDSSVCVRVRDTGRGIRSELLPHVFERFRQADSSSTRSYGGLGLGLAIVRHLVELHGGTVVATSGGEDRGSAFTVRFPLRALFRQEARAFVSPAEPEGTHLFPVSNLTGLRVLVVDDDEDARELVSELLRRAGAEVAMASSAGEALEELRSNPPDVLVSDIGMPGVDGHGLVRQLRAFPTESGGRTPALALTAYAGREHARRALAAGFQRHMAKPADPGELMRIVANLGGRTSDT